MVLAIAQPGPSDAMRVLRPQVLWLKPASLGVLDGFPDRGQAPGVPISHSNTFSD